MRRFAIVALALIIAALIAHGATPSSHAPPATTVTRPKVDENMAAADTETQIWCSVYPHYFTPAPHHTLTARCEFVRYDLGDAEDLYAVWVTDRGPRGDRIYYACVWFDGNQETNFIRVGRVGETHGTVC